jgi:hypothetical protein
MEAGWYRLHSGEHVYVVGVYGEEVMVSNRAGLKTSLISKQAVAAKLDEFPREILAPRPPMVNTSWPDKKD